MDEKIDNENDFDEYDRLLQHKESIFKVKKQSF